MSYVKNYRGGGQIDPPLQAGIGLKVFQTFCAFGCHKERDNLDLHDSFEMLYFLNSSEQIFFSANISKYKFDISSQRGELNQL